MERKAVLQDLIDAIATRRGVPKKRAEQYIRTLFEVVREGLLTDKFVKIKGFGTFKLVTVSERESVNVNTGERIQIESHTKVSFVPDITLKDVINRPFAHFQTVVVSDDTDLTALEAFDMPTEQPEPADEPPTDETSPADPLPYTVASEASEPPQKRQKVKENFSIKTEYIVKEENTTFVSVENSFDEATDTSSAPQPVSPATPAMADEVPTPPAQPTERTSTTPAETSTTIENPVAATEKTSATTGNAEAQPVRIPPQEEAMATDTATDSPAPITDGTEEKSSDTGETNTAPEAGNIGLAQPASAKPAPSAADSVPPQRNDKPTVNWWKTIVIVIGVLFLMLLSYFAGYFRLFCPCEFLDTWHRQIVGPPTEQPAPEQNQAVKPVKTLPDSLKKDTIAPVQPVPAAPEKAPAPSQAPTAPSPTTASPKQRPTAATAEEAVSTPKKQRRPRNTKRKYLITGTRDTYTVDRGETLRSIAEHVYGSKGYAQYIIEYNHISHPDFIEEGTVLRLPELERNPYYEP